MTKERFDLEAVRKRLNEDPTEDSANANDLDDALKEISLLRKKCADWEELHDAHCDRSNCRGLDDLPPERTSEK